MSNFIVDWNGQIITEGDTVIYAPGERYHSGMGYFRVVSIKIVKRERRQYDPTTRGSRVVVEYPRQLRLKPLNFNGGDRTITEWDHPYAFNSLTKFEASLPDRF